MRKKRTKGCAWRYRDGDSCVYLATTPAHAPYWCSEHATDVADVTRNLGITDPTPHLCLGDPKDFWGHVEKVRAEVATWPKWKREAYKIVEGDKS
jgi:hypothetical protein